MPPLSTVTINTGSGNSDGGSSSILNKILNELKKSTGIATKSQKLQMSGLLKGVAGAGAAAAIVTGLAAVSTGIAYGSEALEQKARESGSKNAIEKVLIDGEERILEINQKTGKIVDIMSIREAQEKNLVDENGKILWYLDTQNSIFDKITKDLPKIRDATELTLENIGNINAQGESQLTLNKDITGLLVEKRNRLAAELGRSRVSSEPFTDVSGNFTAGQNGGAIDTARGQSISWNEAQYRASQPFVQLANELLSGYIRNEDPFVQDQKQSMSSQPPLFVNLQSFS